MSNENRCTFPAIERIVSYSSMTIKNGINIDKEQAADMLWEENVQNMSIAKVSRKVNN